MAALWLHCVSLLAVLLVSWPGCQAVHLCGSHLVDVLSWVCGERDFIYSPERDVDPLMGFLTPKVGAASKRDIVEQCCHRPCSIFDLQNYCI